MTSTVAPMVVSLLFLQSLRRFSRLNDRPQWDRPLTILISVPILLFLTDVLFNENPFTKWLWGILLISLAVFSLRQKELRSLRTFVWAYVPFILVMTAGIIIEVVDRDVYSAWEHNLSNIRALMLIWMAAILFTQNRQNKNLEKELLKKKHEDEVNRAIAVRKVELEGLVAERTSELTRQKEELQNALSELRNTQTQLIHSEKMASLGELTAGIAHEIQNPLNFVNNFSEVSNELLTEMKTALEKGDSNEATLLADDVRQNLEKIIHHGKRADAIVKGMLLHSRSSTGMKEPTDLNALVDEYLRLSYHGLRAKDKSFNASMKTDYDESLSSGEDGIGKVKIIPQDVGRVVLNLLTNAFYAVTEKKKTLNELPVSDSASKATYDPTVSVSTRRVGNKAQIIVRDNGNGIPQAALDKIFQPFFTTKPSGQGTGLGLSLSYDIITKGHNGELKVETKEGEGSTFIIQLPAS